MGTRPVTGRNCLYVQRRFSCTVLTATSGSNATFFRAGKLKDVHDRERLAPHWRDLSEPRRNGDDWPSRKPTALTKATRFVIVGTAGAAREDVKSGDVIVVNSAVRDDGVSGHYLPPDAYVDADPSLADERAAALQRRGLQPIVAPTWTVPTPYRSTAAEVELMAREGVAVVECEVASLLAVAEALGVSAGACLYVPGSLTNPAEEPGRDQRTPAVMFNATLEALGLPSQT